MATQGAGEKWTAEQGADGIADRSRMNFRDVRKVCVIGLGRFGMHLAERLSREGLEVIAVDADKSAIEAVQDKVSIPIIGDATDVELLRSFGVDDCDMVVVAIGEDFEAALLTLATLRELNARRIVVRAQDRKKRRILRALGCDRVIMPEEEAAERLATEVTNPFLNKTYELDRDHSIVQVKAPRKAIGISMADLKLRERYSINLAAVKASAQGTIIITRSGAGGLSSADVVRIPTGTTKVHENETLILVGKNEDLDRFLRDYE